MAPKKSKAELYTSNGLDIIIYPQSKDVNKSYAKLVAQEDVYTVRVAKAWLNDGICVSIDSTMFATSDSEVSFTKEELLAIVDAAHLLEKDLK